MENKSVLYQLMDTRMGEALHKITKEDTAFMQTKEKADKYAACFAAQNWHPLICRKKRCV